MYDDPIVQKAKKKTQHKSSYVNPYEILRDVGDETKYQAKEVFSEVVHELFALPKKGDLQPGQELNLKDHKSAESKPRELKSLEKKANYIRPAIEHIDYIGEILKSGEKKTQQDSQEVKQEIQRLILELKSLASSTKTLEKEITEATGPTVVNPGKYHKTFFRWLISIVKDARLKIDNAGVWLSEMSNKQDKKGMFRGKKKKNDYWNMAKQHGTKFTLSGERGIATSAG